MQKIIKIKSHLRKGKLVVSHSRKTATKKNFPNVYKAAEEFRTDVSHPMSDGSYDTKKAERLRKAGVLVKHQGYGKKGHDFNSYSKGEKVKGIVGKYPDKKPGSVKGAKIGRELKIDW